MIMRIGRTISGPRKDTSSTYGQEIARSRKVLGNVLKEKNKQQMKYVLSVAKLRAQGRDLSVGKLKELFNKAILKGEMTLEQMRLLNLYLNSLMPEEAKRFIERFQWF